MSDSVRDKLKPVQPLQVIRTTNKIVGNGTNADPVREIVQYWTTDGELLDECDPHLYEVARVAGKTGRKTGKKTS